MTWTSSIAPAGSRPVAPSHRDTERALGRIDSYPYRHRMRDVMRAPAKFIGRETQHRRRTADHGPRAGFLALYRAGRGRRAAPRPRDRHRHGARRAARSGGGGAGGPRRAGIRDHEPAARRRPGRGLRLSRHRPHEPAEASRHLGVTDEAGRSCGALSARDLLRLRAEEAVMLGDEMDAAEDVHGLGRAWAKLPQVAAALMREGVSGRDIAARDLAASLAS